MALEYKVLHAQIPMFADPEKLRATLAEEARAGWDLVEKLDNHRIKLQRETSHREQDAGLDFDAYRSNVGVSPVVTYGTTALITIAIVAIILYLALWSQN
ncbi:MAG: hypothetical protein WD396_05660 [Pseudohongiellaceae bacterium]